MTESSTFSLYSRRCVLGTTAEDLRIVPARVDVSGSLIEGVFEGHTCELVDRDNAIDLGDQLLAPAFVNGHTHLALNSCRGLGDVASLRANMIEDLFFQIESHLKPEDVTAMARVGALECLAHGVGFVHDHYYFGEQVAEALRDVGLAGIVAPTLQDLAGPGVSWLESQIEATRALASDSKWSDVGIGAALGPHATDTVSTELWKRCFELASSLDIPLHAHLAQRSVEVERVYEREGVTPLAWLEKEGFLLAPVRQLLVHGLFLGKADLERLDAEHHVLGSNPFSQLQFGFPAPVEEWTEANIPWSVGTDAVASNDSMQVQKELRLLAGQSTYGVTWSVPRRRMRFSLDLDSVDAVETLRREIVANATNITSPRFLLSRVWDVPGNIHSRVTAGAIEAGRLANFCVFDTEHPAFWPADDVFRVLAFADPLPAMTSLMVAGRWIGEQGDPQAALRSPDAKEMVNEATRRRGELLRRAGLRA